MLMRDLFIAGNRLWRFLCLQCQVVLQQLSIAGESKVLPIDIALADEDDIDGLVAGQIAFCHRTYPPVCIFALGEAVLYSRRYRIRLDLLFRALPFPLSAVLGDIRSAVQLEAGLVGTYIVSPGHCLGVGIFDLEGIRYNTRHAAELGMCSCGHQKDTGNKEH